MRYILKLPTKGDLEVECKPGDTVQKLREKAATEEQLEPEQLQLVFGSNKLDENAAIETCNVPDGSQITVMKLMKFTLNLPSGRDLPAFTDRSDLVKKILDLAATATNIEAEQLQLIYEGKKLDENSTIESCNVPEGSKITVMTVVKA